MVLYINEYIVVTMIKLFSYEQTQNFGGFSKMILNQKNQEKKGKEIYQKETQEDQEEIQEEMYHKETQIDQEEIQEMYKNKEHSLEYIKKNLFSCNEFYAILKKGITVLFLNVCCVYCYHIIPSFNNKYLVFLMTLPEATFIENEYPEFVSTGISAKWKFNNLKNGYWYKVLSTKSFKMASLV